MSCEKEVQKGARVHCTDRQAEEAEEGRARRDLAVMVLVDAGRDRRGDLQCKAGTTRIDPASLHLIPAGEVWIRG